MVAEIGRHSLSNEVVHASICHVDPTEIEQVKLSDLAKMERRDRREIIAFSKSYLEQLTIALSNHGDRRLENPRRIAQEFGNQTIERVLSLEAPDYTDHIKVAAAYGISPLLLNDKMTVGEFSEMVARGTYIKKRLEQLKLDSSDEAIQRCMLSSPTDRLWWQIIRKQKKLQRAEGGNLSDASLAVLVLYADVLHVDKRTKEIFNQMGREETISVEIAKQTLRGGDYAVVIQLLEEHLARTAKRFK
jgi:hypothetical protein